MSRSTFSGPVLVGEGDANTFTASPDTSERGPNWGFVNMVQSAAIEQMSGVRTTSIVLPYKSTITRISTLVSVVYSNPSYKIDIGTAWGPYPGPLVDLTDASEYDQDEICNNADVVVILGINVVDVGTGDFTIAGEVDNWMRLPRTPESEQTDRIITYSGGGGGVSGRAVLTVEYCQAVDLSAIA